MKRSSIVMTAIAACVVAVAAYLLLQQNTSLPRDPLAIVPADAFALARIKASRVVKSEAWKRLVVARDEARGIERVEAECGFNPFAELEDIIVFARSSPQGGMPRFAFAARGPLKHEAIIDCLRKMTGSGSKLITEDVEGITTVRSGKGSSRAAFVGRDGVIGGDAESVRAMIFTIKGKAQSAASDPLFRELFASVQQGTDVAVVGRMPDEVIPMVRALGRMGGDALSGLTESKAIALSGTTADDRIQGGAVIVAPNSDSAKALVDVVEMVRGRLLEIPGIGLTPANSLLNSIKMEALKENATFTGNIKVSTAEMLIDLLPTLMALGGDNPGQKAAAAAAQYLGTGRPAPQAPSQPDAPAPQAPAQPAPATQPGAPGTSPAPGTPTVQSLSPAPATKKKTAPPAAK